MRKRQIADEIPNAPDGIADIHEGALAHFSGGGGFLEWLKGVFSGGGGGTNTNTNTNNNNQKQEVRVNSPGNSGGSPDAGAPDGGKAPQPATKPTK